MEKNSQTIRTLMNKDYETLIRYGNDHLDSPTGLILLDMLMQEKGRKEINILADTTSYEFTSKREGVTSYIVGIY